MVTSGGCVRGRDNCGCRCHYSPGVNHIVACCDAPRYSEEGDSFDQLLSVSIASQVDAAKKAVKKEEPKAKKSLRRRKGMLRRRSKGGVRGGSKSA